MQQSPTFELIANTANSDVLANRRAQVAIGFCVVVWLSLLWVSPGLLRIAFPLMSFVCAGYLFWQHEPEYVSFTWWLYFLTPFLRRVVDYRAGFDPLEIMSVAPLLATAIACVELRKLTRLTPAAVPFAILTMVSIYGVVVSVATRTPLITTVEFFLLWISPVAFGYRLVNSRAKYPELKKALQNTFTWGLLVLGSYGIYQYLVAPPWDSAWMQNVEEKISSFGSPEPMGIRVFSTMSGPQPLALTLVMGLIIMLSARQSIVRIVASVAGYMALLLTMARSGWLEWSIALVLFAILSWSRKIALTILAVTVLAGSVTSILTMSPAGETLRARFEAMKEMQDDQSKRDREQTYQVVLRRGLNFPFGRGWDAENGKNYDPGIHDSTVIETLMCLGWFALVAVYLSLLLAIGLILRGLRGSNDKFVTLCCGLLIALLVETILNSLIVGLGAMMIWTVIGMAFSGQGFNKAEWTYITA